MREGLPGDHAVLPGSAAEIAGLKEHDVIVAVNGKDITEQDTLEDVLENCSVGDELAINVVRKGNNFSTKVLLEDRAKFA